jgi:hypothetical protein
VKPPFMPLCQASHGASTEAAPSAPDRSAIAPPMSVLQQQQCGSNWCVSTEAAPSAPDRSAFFSAATHVSPAAAAAAAVRQQLVCQRQHRGSSLCTQPICCEATHVSPAAAAAVRQQLVCQRQHRGSSLCTQPICCGATHVSPAAAAAAVQQQLVSQRQHEVDSSAPGYLPCNSYTIRQLRCCCDAHSSVRHQRAALCCVLEHANQHCEIACELALCWELRM